MPTTKTRYTLYTIADGVPFYASFDQAQRPAMVTCTEWSVSRTSVCRMFSSPSVVARDDGMVTLNAFRFDAQNNTIRHELDGTRYPTDRDAQRAAYDAGLLAHMVYHTQEGAV